MRKYFLTLSLKSLLAIPLLFFLNFIPNNLFSQDHVPLSIKYGFSYKEIDTRFFSLDGERISMVSEYNDSKDQLPMRAGFAIDANLNFNNSGSLITWPNGEQSWLLKILLHNAPYIVLTFDEVRIPEGAKIFVFSKSQNDPIAILTSQNVVSNTLSCPILSGEEVFIEYHEPGKHSSNFFKGNFKLKEVVYINNHFRVEKDLGDAATCHINVNCPEGANWQKQKRGVARILFRVGSSWYWCTGSLVNNTAQNAKPYFLTAEHCGGTASVDDRYVWQFYFNFERPTCSNTGAPPINLITGCTLKAKGPMAGGSDFQLVELVSAPEESWNPYYNGWTRNPVGSTSGVGIHHPRGDAKKISTYSTQLVSSTPNISGSFMGNNAAWRINWSATGTGHGVTEGGSSGSPLFNPNGLIVGTLTGGSSNCVNPNNFDYYGKFDYHWASNGLSSAERLGFWLDPQGYNLFSLKGYDPFGGLVADFFSDKTQVNVGDNVVFTDLSAGGTITSWSWNFGEGAIPQSATGKGPHSVTYSSTGTKNISLIINGSIVETKTNLINVNPSVFVSPNSLNYQILNDNNVKLVWNYPRVTHNEGFENYQDFSLAFNPWIQHDLDGRFTTNISNASFPNQNYTGSFIVFNSSQTSPAISGAWAPIFGNKYLACFSIIPGNGVIANNDWLVSPEIKVLSGYKLKFWARAASSQHNFDRIRVSISTTGSQPANFNVIHSGQFLEVPDEWTEYIFNLNTFNGSKVRFAINCVSENSLALLLDGISVTDATGKNVLTYSETDYSENAFGNKALVSAEKGMVQISGYKVYRNNVAIATLTNPDVLEYIDTNLPNGEFTYKVAATYSSPEGESVPSSAVTVSITGTSINPDELSSVNVYPNPFSQLISIANAQRVKQVEVTNVLGQKIMTIVNNGNEMISIDSSKLPTGVYIVTLYSVENSSRIVKMIKR